MERKIPVPAESARQMALSAMQDGVPRLREKGYGASANHTERAVANILQATAGERGGFVSVDAGDLGTVVADSENFSHHREAAKHFLVQYKYWD